MSWVERASETLLPLSRAVTLSAALAEWRYTGRFTDLETPQETCQLCGQQDLRYQFEIENAFCGAALMVGSECIKRFNIGGLDEHGQPMDAARTARLVDRDRRHLVDDARKKRVMTSLLRLGAAATNVDAASFMTYVDGRGAFTPNQLAYLFWQMDSHRIAYRPTDYKLTIRRDREKAQLRAMKPAAFARVVRAMTPTQRAWMDKVQANFARWGQSWR